MSRIHRLKCQKIEKKEKRKKKRKEILYLQQKEKI